MYRAVLDRACTRLAETVGTGNYGEDAIATLVAAAAELDRRGLATQIPAGPWLDWAARLIPAVTTEAVIAWLDAGQPDPGHAARRIGQVIHGAIQAAKP